MPQMTLWPTGEVGGDAIIDGPYRYLLRRWWVQDDRTLLWVLLNPSKADGNTNDASLLRMISFTRREGYHRLEVVNLYAWRSTDPKELHQAEDPVGPQNNIYITRAAERADKIVVGWGNNNFGQRAREVLPLLEGRPLWAFGITQKGHPRHPLYLKSDELLLPLAHSALFDRPCKGKGKNI